MAEIWLLCFRRDAVLANRSIPPSPVIPVLAYPDVTQAAAWLSDVFGFTVRVRIGSHRVQLNVGQGAVILRELRPAEAGATLGIGYSVTVRVRDLDAHCRRAKSHGARVTHEPDTHPYGERQYTVQDLAGHTWTFSQSIADVAPEEWGGTSEEL